MRVLLIAYCLAAFAVRGAEPAELHYSKPEVRKEIVAVVEAQLAAFRANDFEQAYGFAADVLHQQFTLAQFTVMITRGYPIILHNERADFGLPQDDGATAVVVVQVSASGNRSASYRYNFVREPGGWRISGVQLEKPRANDA